MKSSSPGLLFVGRFLFFNFIYLLLADLGLHCYLGIFSSCSWWGLFSCDAQASHCGGFFCRGAQALGVQVLVVLQGSRAQAQ